MRYFAPSAWYKKKVNQCPSLANFCVYREQPLKTIADLFAQQGVEKSVVAILGDTTKGKTELAKQYIKRHGHKYHHKWFIDAKNWKSEYRNLAFVLELVSQAEKDTLPDEIIVKKVHDVFSQKRTFGVKSLIVFDDAPEGFIEDSLKGVLPSNTDILVTAQSGIVEHQINLTSDETFFLTEEEGIAIFTKRMSLSALQASEIRKIVRQFKNLPVVLAQAAHYLQKHPERIESYLDLFEKDKREVLKQGALKNPSEVGSIDVYVSILMNMQVIKKEFPAAIAFLYYCIYLPHENIPKKWLVQLTRGTQALDPLLATLQVWIIPNKETVSIHQTLQRILQEILEKEMAQELSTKKEVLSKLGERALDFTPFLAQEPSKAEEIYLQAVQDEQRKSKPDQLKGAHFSFALGDTQRQLLKYPAALEAYKTALSMYRECLGDDHPNVATSLNNMGSVLKDMGKYEEAFKYQKEALALSKKLLEDHHPSVATSLNNVGTVLREMGKYEEALQYIREALELRKKLFGDNHLDVAKSLNNVGETLRVMGKYDEALKYQKEALQLRKGLLGDNHSDVAASLQNIGLIFGEMGKHGEALEYLKEALELWKRLPGDNRPNIAKSLNSVGSTLADMGQHAEALKYQKEAFELRKQFLRNDHPDMAISLNNIGETLRKMGKYDAALEYLKEALELRKKLLGNNHSNVAMSLNNVGGALEGMGRGQEALEHFVQSYKILFACFTKKHPYHAAVLNNLIFCLAHQTDPLLIEKTKREILPLAIKRLGEEHPLIIALREVKIPK